MFRTQRFKILEYSHTYTNDILINRIQADQSCKLVRRNMEYN